MTRLTHCRNGHAYDAENTTFVKRGKYAGERRCATCARNSKSAQKIRDNKKLAEKQARKKESWFF